MVQLPELFVGKMRNLLAAEADAFLATYDQPRSFGLRINTLKIGADEFLARSPFELRPVPWTKSGFYYPEGAQPGKHPYHAAGLYYLQEPSAMAVAELAQPRPGERVLDLCAAPGGKTTQLAALMQDEGLLVANEINPTRAKALAENVERWGAKQVVVTSAQPAELARRFGAYFDCIVVDAPCSGEGMFRKDPEACRHWNEGAVLACATTQVGILDEAYRLLAPGGRLVYSTCTFSPEENEENIAAFLDRRPDMALVAADSGGHFQPGRAAGDRDELALTARLWPHQLEGEGHFLALLKKAGGMADYGLSDQEGSLYEKPDAELVSFAQEALKELPKGPYLRFGDHLYQAASVHLPKLSGLRVLRPGWPLGELRKGRFQPSHALALGLEAHEAQRVHRLASNSSQVQAYLRGQTLPTDLPNGWALVVVDGFPLGWGKAVSGVLKNHYPKGLRWLG